MINNLFSDHEAAAEVPENRVQSLHRALTTPPPCRPPPPPLYWPSLPRAAPTQGAYSNLDGWSIHTVKFLSGFVG